MFLPGFLGISYFRQRLINFKGGGGLKHIWRMDLDTSLVFLFFCVTKKAETYLHKYSPTDNSQ